MNNAAQQAEAQRFRKQSKKIGRKLSRRLSLIAKVPNIFNVKFTGTESPAVPQKNVNGVAAIVADCSVALAYEITVIAPDKTQRLVSTYFEIVFEQSSFFFRFCSQHVGLYHPFYISSSDVTNVP